MPEDILNYIKFGEEFEDNKNIILGFYIDLLNFIVK
jgi:hypothetical protein